jgi:hypothetical protein
VLVSRAELEKVFNNTAMKNRYVRISVCQTGNNHSSTIFRTLRFAILGLSLSTLLDITHPQDLLRALLNAITEYDQGKEEGDNKSSKMVKAALAF